jgi:chaperone LolA
MKSLLKISFTLAIVVTFALISKAQNADKILEDLSSITNSYNNIKATFAYKMINTDAGIDEVTNGTLIVQGDQYNLNIAGQIVISDGKTLWTYIPDSEEVQINEVSEEDGFTPSKLLSSYNNDYSSKMMDDFTADGETFYQLHLEPRNEDSNFDYVILVIKKEPLQLAKFIIHDFDGNVFSYEIKQFVTNSEISIGTFSFDETAHPGVEVIDMR